jgi:cytochrome b561
MNSNSPTRYGTVAMTLHWLIGLSIIGLLIVGTYMHDLPREDPNRFMLYQLHKSLGLSVLVLSVFRVRWRLANPVPALPAGMAPWEQWAARLTHLAFYVLIIVMPLSGWAVASSSTSGVPTLWFGLFEVPSMPGIPSDREVHEQAEEVHELLGKLMIALVVLHVGAALKHHFWDRDTVLKRMLPFTKV